jgi:hypothetical protein
VEQELLSVIDPADGAVIEDGRLSARLPKLSWNVIRLRGKRP